MAIVRTADPTKEARMPARGPSERGNDQPEPAPAEDPGGWKLALVRDPGSFVLGCVIVGVAAALLTWACRAARSPELGYLFLLISIVAFLAIMPGVWLARRWRARALVALAGSIGDLDPGDSPVPWISTALWRRENRRSLEMELETGPATLAPCLVDATAFVAEAADQAGAPVAVVADDAPVPEPAPRAKLQAQLEAPPNATGLYLDLPSWPVCCERLTTLVDCGFGDGGLPDALPEAHHLRAEIRAMADAADEAEVERYAAEPYGKEELEDGVALFHCRACGRVYLGSYHP